MAEAASTQLAGVEFLSGVNALVSRQIGLSEEGLGAELTPERFLTGVHVSVLLA